MERRSKERLFQILILPANHQKQSKRSFSRHEATLRWSLKLIKKIYDSYSSCQMIFALICFNLTEDNVFRAFPTPPPPSLKHVGRKLSALSESAVIRARDEGLDDWGLETDSNVYPPVEAVSRSAREHCWDRPAVTPREFFNALVCYARRLKNRRRQPGLD